MQEQMGIGQNIVGGIQTGKTVRGFFPAKAPTGSGTTPSGSPVGSSGSSSSISTPNVSNGSLPSSAPDGAGSTAAGEESAFASLGPPVMAGIAGAFQMKSNYDWQTKGSKAGNAKYATKNGPQIQWDSDTINRRMSFMGDAKKDNFLEAKKLVPSLPLAQGDKDSILQKLTKAINLSALTKRG